MTTVSDKIDPKAIACKKDRDVKDNLAGVISAGQFHGHLDSELEQRVQVEEQGRKLQ